MTTCREVGSRIAATLRRPAIHAGPTVLGIIVLDFLFLQLMPGDPADVIATESGAATVGPWRRCASASSTSRC